MSSEITFDGGGFEDFEELLKQYSENVSSDKALDAVEEGAKEFVNDLLRLPKPRSQITKAGYTHIVSTFALERTDSGIKVGGGKYYGPMLEHGNQEDGSKAALEATL